jgi:hypothetical protein
VERETLGCRQNQGRRSGREGEGSRERMGKSCGIGGMAVFWSGGMDEDDRWMFFSWWDVMYKVEKVTLWAGKSPLW